MRSRGIKVPILSSKNKRTGLMERSSFERGTLILERVQQLNGFLRITLSSLLRLALPIFSIKSIGRLPLLFLAFLLAPFIKSNLRLRVCSK